MLFNSVEFLIFLPIVFCLYWFVFNRSLRWQNVLVITASYFFYGWWSWKFLGLIALSTLLDYVYGFYVASENRKKARFFLWLSTVNNLGILGLFKYFDFFSAQFQRGLETLGIHSDPIILNLALPIGISFYTFHGMSYVFDIYWGKQKPVGNFIDYAVFVSFFPLLVAGPIERANHLLPQVIKARIFSFTQAVEGSRLILWGLFKKVVVADGLAGLTDMVFGNFQHLGPLTLLVGAMAFSFQIYCDFSGYSDIAIGTAKLFGFELLSNFRFPYLSRNIAEFWRRWHISLSSWFRDYLYIPLGGSKGTIFKTIRNTFIIFLVSGFWHGASWNFVAWGFVHACAFLPLLVFRKNRNYMDDVVAQNSRLPSFKEVFQVLRTFIFVTLAWVFFRMDSMSNVFAYFRQLIHGVLNFSADSFSLVGVKTLVLLSLPVILADFYFRRDERKLAFPKGPLEFVIIGIFVLSIMLSFSKATSFIYFQF